MKTQYRSSDSDPPVAGKHGLSNSLNKTKRSKTMNARHVSTCLLQKGLVAIALLAVLAVTAFGQDVTNAGTGTIANTGLIKIKGTFTPASQTSIGGTVEYNKAGSAKRPSTHVFQLDSLGRGRGQNSCRHDNSGCSHRQQHRLCVQGWWSNPRP